MKHTHVWLAAGMLCLAACSQEPDQATQTGASDPELFMDCAESRGSLLELEGMISGGKRVNTSSLEHGAGMLGRLADRVSAPGEVRADLSRWTHAVETWGDQLRALPPQIENGRVIEPDTSALDAALLSELQRVRKPLAEWVEQVCANAQL